MMDTRPDMEQGKSFSMAHTEAIAPDRSEFDCLDGRKCNGNNVVSAVLLVA